MGYNFSKQEEEMISKLHPDLRLIIVTAAFFISFRIAQSTIRTKEQQAEFVKKGLSKILNSMHLPRPFPEYGNKELVCAFDGLPLFEGGKIDYNDLGAFCYFAGFIMGTAAFLFREGKITHKLRWGGDWNKNYRTNDEKFKDLGHFEMILD